MVVKDDTYANNDEEFITISDSNIKTVNVEKFMSESISKNLEEPSNELSPNVFIAETKLESTMSLKDSNNNKMDLLNTEEI